MLCKMMQVKHFADPYTRKEAEQIDKFLGEWKSEKKFALEVPLEASIISRKCDRDAGRRMCFPLTGHYRRLTCRVLSSLLYILSMRIENVLYSNRMDPLE